MSVSLVRVEAAFIILSQKPSHLRHPRGHSSMALRWGDGDSCAENVSSFCVQDKILVLDCKCAVRPFHTGPSGEALGLSSFELPLTGPGHMCPSPFWEFTMQRHREGRGEEGVHFQTFLFAGDRTITEIYSWAKCIENVTVSKSSRQAYSAASTPKAPWKCQKRSQSHCEGQRLRMIDNVL